MLGGRNIDVQYILGMSQIDLNVKFTPEMRMQFYMLYPVLL